MFTWPRRDRSVNRRVLRGMVKGLTKTAVRPKQVKYPSDVEYILNSASKKLRAVATSVARVDRLISISVRGSTEVNRGTVGMSACGLTIVKPVLCC